VGLRLETDEVAAIMRKYRTALSAGEGQDGSIGNALLGLPCCLGRQDVVSA
jgi:hypothetical protein